MLSFHNTLSRKVEPFEPLTPPEVRLYACGPTVYDYAHIGNFRFNVWIDILRRTLEWRGFPVRMVMNITDVDDNTIAGAQRSKKSLGEYTERYATAFFEDIEALRILPATHYPRATDHIEKMVALVERLLEGGHAYRQEGSVYFRVAGFPGYGRLSRLDPGQLRSSGRVDGDAYEKEDARDFALWKAAKEGEPAWQTPFGRGRPGWHLECSAMSMEYLGNTFDIHAGGVDLIFPHHENELAQSSAATGESLARTWVHCAHLIVDGVKMSKSLGNQYTLRQLMAEGHDPVAIRYLLASVHYRKQLNFTFEALEQAKASVARLAELVLRLEQEMPFLPCGVGDPEAEPGSDQGVEQALAAADAGFGAALDDDLNTSGALGHLFMLVRAANTSLDRGTMNQGVAAKVVAWLRDVDRIWAVLPDPEQLLERRVQLGGTSLLAVGPPLAEDLIEMILARMKARKDHDFTAADQLRADLRKLGVELEDTAQGVRWHRRPAMDSK
ncbi:MAG: cysteine--tRNA ligase [Acidobacteriota bacterium]